jgi:uncharacterized membrane-anchored protein
VNVRELNLNNSIVYDNIEKYEKKNSKYKNIVTPRFDRTYARGPDLNTPLPAFMDNIHSRQTLNTLSRKMLETNHFQEGDFQTIHSSFNPTAVWRGLRR